MTLFPLAKVMILASLPKNKQQIKITRNDNFCRDSFLIEKMLLRFPDSEEKS